MNAQDVLIFLLAKVPPVLGVRFVLTPSPVNAHAISGVAALLSSAPSVHLWEICE